MTDTPEIAAIREIIAVLDRDDWQATRWPQAVASLRSLLAAHDARDDAALTSGRYRKRPVVIEAVQLRQRFPWPEWFHDAVTANEIVTHGLGKFADGPVFCEIATLEGTMRAEDGDWIIRGVKGEVYPCKPDIFAATYEAVETAPDERESAPSVEVRAAVVIAADGGDWFIAGWPGASNVEARSYAANEVDGTIGAVHFITARVPLPVSTEIEGRVEQ